MSYTKIASLFADMDALAGQTVTVGGWARTIRDMKNFGFIELNDGSCMKNLQVVMETGTLENYKDIASQNVGAALIVTGTVVLTPEAKQPLEYPSAGSTFKRPAPLPDGTPVYAAELIDRCGCKGLKIGGAMVSEKHAGFIVNTGGATCADILALMEEVKKRVLAQTGIGLEPEVKTLGV